MSSIRGIISEFLRVAKNVTEALPPHRIQGASENDEELMVKTLSETRLERLRISEVRARHRWRFLVVDGSSRSFGTSNFRMFIVGAVAYGHGGPLITYPQTSLGRGISVDWGFAGLKAPEGLSKLVEENELLSRHIRVRSLDGGYFVDYDDAVVSDEVRMGLETMFIKALEEGNHLGSDTLLVIDGPIYLAMKERKELARRRVEVVDELSRAGIPTLNIVKRVELSRKLCKDEVLNYVKDQAKGFSINPSMCNDAAFMHELGQRLETRLGEAVILGPLKISARGDLTAFFTEDRVFWYVYTGVGSVFRVETIESIYRGREDELNDTVKWLVSIIDRNGLPYILDVADYYAKAVTRNLYITLYQVMMEGGVRPTYDTQQEFMRVLGEEHAEPQ